MVTRGNDVWTYTYDADGNILSVTKNEATIKSYSYPEEGWTDKLTLVAALIYGNGNSVGYRYDRLDRLTEKTYNGSVAARLATSLA